MSNSFIPANLKIVAAETVLPFYEQLLNQPIANSEELNTWLHRISELESFISEDMAWRYINMTCHTQNEEFKNSYLDFVNNINPVLSPLSNQLNTKMIDNSQWASSEDKSLQLYIKKVKTEIELFRDENIEIQAKLQNLAQTYSSINGSLSIHYQDKELTLQQAAIFLKNKDRLIRKEVYELINLKRQSVKDQLNELFLEMIQLRQQLAINAGFNNFRDYMFKAMNRFDYAPQDCYDFHTAIAEHLVPLAKSLHKERKKAMLLNELKPYDLDVDKFGREALKPFDNATQLYDKTLNCLTKTDAQFGEVLQTLNNMNQLDLDSRMGKAPGGYNYPLLKTGVPFIFMNASGSLRDVETLIHEAGHAVHSVLTHDLSLAAYKEMPSEVAELASMSMELITRMNWDEIFDNEDELKRAKKEQLEDIIATLPWIATIDRFQHEIYLAKDPTIDDLTKIWKDTLEMFGTNEVDFTDYQSFLNCSWHRQLHLFEVPFYYIEYGFAQLGALAVWREQMTKGNEAITAYKTALKAGSTVSIPQVYALANIRFDFSEKYIKTIADFLSNQLNVEA
jgi:oligoendopeptidase F